MDSLAKLQPLTSFTTKQIFGETGEEMKVKYLIGNPRQYRYDASKGLVTLNGEIPVTRSMESFTFTPIAYRLFRDSLFIKKGADENVKDWVEFFFLNEALQICVISFHGFSVEAFLQHYADYLFYDDLTPCEAIITMTPQAKQKHTTNQETGKPVVVGYTIAAFSSKKATPETVQATKFLNECVSEIYRRDTFKELVKHTESQNYKLSETAISANMRLIDEAKEKEALIKEFDSGAVSSGRKLKRAA